MSPLVVQTTDPLCSHAPLHFSVKPQARYDATRHAASRLLYISDWKLNSESARDQPRLRNLLGHLSVHDQARSITHTQTRSPPPEPEQSNELSTYLQQVPSFREFQAAIEVQLATIVQITAAAAQLKFVNNHRYEAAEEDSDCDSYEGDWSDEDTAAESDDSLTDNDSLGTASECSSPTSCSSKVRHGDGDEEELDLWALRPMAPYMREQPVLS
ncbi:hypothetical protein A1O1_08142 [Capronia coronata CBS 617.96]|uniref:Uncharacterized protein n=1 Tax=Capronia coronata CBS 617.96 TaxID=1182541 RepID=W9XPC9_9EURO|nr:uncharacterized protein A1O1_08142 [Capronia coronata CBS 617.96]EXJ82073.1 hypothetical protein A1O1_08142 [Capronia coronata CBS 617.96]